MKDGFVAGTMISTPNGPRAIETLLAGDLVATPFGAQRVVTNMARHADALVALTFRLRDLEVEPALGCTPEHLFAARPYHARWVEPHWVAAQDLSAADSLIPESAADEFTIWSIDPMGSGVVYNLTVKEAHCYYADHLLVSDGASSPTAQSERDVGYA